MQQSAKYAHSAYSRFSDMPIKLVKRKKRDYIRYKDEHPAVKKQTKRLVENCREQDVNSRRSCSVLFMSWLSVSCLVRKMVTS